MKLEDIKKDLENGGTHCRGVCHDCNDKVEIDVVVSKEGYITITGGAVYKIREGLNIRYFFKCDECYKKDKTLRNFRETEVYSRAVGYLRPVKQWNKGKKEEFKQRKLFANTRGK